MPDTIRLTIDFNKQKYNALTEHLSKKHVSVEEALEHNLDAFYERYVPEDERKDIAERTRFENFDFLKNTNVPARKVFCYHASRERRRVDFQIRYAH